MSKLNLIVGYERRLSYIEKCEKLLLVADLHSNNKFCWISALNIRRISEDAYELAKLLGRYVLGDTISALAKVFGWNPYARTDNILNAEGVAHISISSRPCVNYIKTIQLQVESDMPYGSHADVGRTMTFSITNCAQTNTIGYDNASGALGQFAKDYVSGALMCPYACNASQQEAIRAAFDNRLVLFKYPGKEVSHPHLKFLADHMNDGLLDQDYEGQRVKIIGPKFSNREVEAIKSAESVHFCTKKPAKLDVNRGLESEKDIKRKIRGIERKIAMLDEQISGLRKEQEKKAGSLYVVEISKNIMTFVDSINKLMDEKETQNDYLKAVTENSNYCSANCCNVGVEDCTEPCDTAIALHSIYDVNIAKMLRKQGKLGLRELFCTVILPFGLLFVDSYYSEELQVQFRRDGKGFLMIHGKDMSNGYAHESSVQIMNLMRNSFVRAGEEIWAYEIVESKGEMCKLRFTRASENQRIVRKLMPSKFDNYTVIMNPLDYFSRVPKRSPIMVRKDKLEAAIKSVERSKKSKEIIEDTYSFVQASYMKVVVGKTELQSGGELDCDTEAAIVLDAIIEGGIRKHIVGETYKRSLRAGLLEDAKHEAIKLALEVLLPVDAKWLISFFTKSRAEKFMKERINLGDLILDSRANYVSKSLTFFDLVLGHYGFDSEEMFDRLPSFREFVIKDDFDFGSDELGEAMHQFICSRVSPAVHKQQFEDKRKAEEEKKQVQALTRAAEYLDARVRLAEFKEEAAQIEQAAKEEAEREEEERKRRKLEKKQELKIEQSTVKKDKGKEKVITIMEENLETMKPDIESEIAVFEAISSGSSTLADESEEIFSDDEEDIAEVEFSEHDGESTLHKKGLMDDVTKAALAHNIKRAQVIKSCNGKHEIPQKMIEAYIKRYSKKGRATNPRIPKEQIEKEVESLKNAYAVDSSTCVSPILKGLKDQVLKAIKSVMNDGSLDKIKDKIVEIIQGFAGSGKTKLMLDNFDVTKDAYISPLANILFKFSADLKKEKKEAMRFCKREDMLKTYEKFSEIRRSGGTLYIDECSKFPLSFILVILAYTNYDNYVLVGDPEQTGVYDPTSEMSGCKYVDLIDEDDITRLFYTFRFGPTVAAFLNTAYNYPVFSLKSTDTKLHYHDLDTFDSSCKGTNLTITTETRDNYKDNFQIENIMTATASQGLTVDRVNLLMTNKDAQAALAFRNNGIVAASRMTEELHIYYNTTSKKKNVTNLEWLRENYATIFDIVVPDIVDF